MRRIVYAEKNVDGHIVPGSKTGEDRARSVTLLAPLRRDLLAFRLAAGNPPDDALVLPQADGRPWRLHDYKNWQRPAVKTERSRRAASIFAAAATAIGRPDATPYFLRHTYASLRLAEQRLSLQEIAEEMGHTVEVLARTYAHVISEYRGRGPIAPDALITRARRRETPQKRPKPHHQQLELLKPTGDSNPRPHITSVPLSMVGVSRHQFAVTSEDSGPAWTARDRPNAPKMPRRSDADEGQWAARQRLARTAAQDHVAASRWSAPVTPGAAGRHPRTAVGCSAGGTRRQSGHPAQTCDSASGERVLERPRLERRWPR